MSQKSLQAITGLTWHHIFIYDTHSPATVFEPLQSPSSFQGTEAAGDLRLRRTERYIRLLFGIIAHRNLIFFVFVHLIAFSSMSIEFH